MSKQAVIKINGETYVAGMNWLRAENDSLNKPAKMARENGAEMYCLAKNDTGGGTLGMIRAEDAGKEMLKMGSLAAALAQSESHAMVVAKLRDEATGKDVFWMAAIDEEGNVTPGTDIVSEDDGVIAQEAKLQMQFQKDIKIIVTEDILHLFETFNPDVVDISQVLSGCRAKDVRIRSAKDASKQIIGTVIAVVVVGVVAWVALTFIGKEEPVEPQMKGLTAEQIKQIQVDRFVKSTMAAVGILLPTDGDVSWVMKMRDVSFQMPLSSEGFHLETITCQASGVCEYKFEKTGNAYIEAFEDRYAGVSESGVTFPLDGEGATFSRKYQVENKPGERTTDFIKKAPKAKDFYKTLLSRFNALENAGITGWKRSAKQPVIAGGSASPSEEYPTLYSGSIKISIDQLWLLKTFLELLDNEYISVTKFTVRVGDKPQITLEANYVVAR